jgi:ABC-2 type transport system permease protein
MSGRRVISLVAFREIRERLRSPAFLWSTVIMLVIIGASSVLPALLENEQQYRVAVVAPAPRGLDALMQRAAETFEANIQLRVVGSETAGRDELTAKKVDALLLLGDDQIVFRADIDTRLAAAADAAVRALRRQLPPAPELTSTMLEPSGPGKSDDAEALVAMLGAALLLGSLAVYGQWVLAGVVEEKSNRVVELILSTVRPRDLLVGKVIGIGMLGLTQLALIVGLVASLLAAGVYDAPTSLGRSVVLVVPWFALGFALYAVAYAGAGALAAQQQDANSAGQPVTYTLLAAFFIGYAALTANADSAIAHVLTVFPLTAPLVLPARSALVGVPLWEHALAFALVLGSIYLIVRLAGGVYAQGLLHGGSRLPIRAAWRLRHES